ncbi:DcuS/MalK family sensor histidine kinase [Paenibacillus sp. FSL R5-0527]|uniref:DcuS/MalK family sensor histidine kinase n=1 Tax=Paenibacillus sp. FSL R5-0527 TaxID=2975321 RepID=UPI00097A0998|nr:two-component system sensor histidine kinase DcuS [Paenibacillus macerans]
MKFFGRTLRLQTTITLMVCSVLALVLLAVYLLFNMKSSGLTRQDLEHKAITIARTVSRDPTVQSALNGQADAGLVQEFTEEIRTLNGVQFIVVMDEQGIRLSHPDPAKIGQHFIGGDEAAALSGRESVSIAKGTLGKSVRAFSPVIVGGKPVGAVAVGLALNDVNSAVRQNRWIIYLGMAAGGVLGVSGAVLLARRLKRMMFGMEPDEIAKLLEERSAMLQSAKEGIIAVDALGVITLINAEASRLIGITEAGGNAQELCPLLRMDKVLETGEPLNDMEMEQDGMTLLANVVPVKVNGRTQGAIATFRDKTEIDVLMERLSGVSLYVEALRAQTHEFMNKLHVMAGLNHMRRYDRLEEYLSGTIRHFQSEAGMLVKQVKDPVMAGFLLGKLSRAREAGVKMHILEEDVLPECADAETAHELVTIVGNLLENALEAEPGEESKDISVGFSHENSQLTVTVSDNGAGIPGEMIKRIYEQGFSTKGKGRGIGLYLVMRGVNKLGGRLWCQSAQGSGTKFIVRIPYEAKAWGTHDS